MFFFYIQFKFRLIEPLGPLGATTQAVNENVDIKAVFNVL